MTSLTDGYYGQTAGSYVTGKTTLWALADLAIFLLLIASFNFINLSTGISAKRSKEVGIRKVTGSSRLMLFSQFVTEMLLISLLSVMASLSIFYCILSLINQNLAIVNLQLYAGYDVLLFALVLVIILTLVAGFYPAFVLSGFKPIAVLKNKFTTTKNSILNLRQGLIGLQFSITFFILVCAAVVVMQFNYFMHKDLGFNKDAIITVNIPRQNASILETFRQELLRDPHVQEISCASGAPTATNSHYGTSFRLRGEPESMMRAAEMKVVDIHYLSLYNLQIRTGRWLNGSDTVLSVKNGITGFVVNEWLVKTLGLKEDEAIGKEVVINEGQAPIIGVLKDFNNNPLQDNITPCLLFYKSVDFFSEASIQLATKENDPIDLSRTLAFVENTWKKFFPESIYRYNFLDDALAKNYSIENFLSKAFRLFSWITFFISVLGLFGLVIFIAEQRKKEIGVRKVLGATITSIIVLLSSDLVRPVILAICLASPLTWLAVHSWLNRFAYRVTVSWWLYGSADIAIVAIALVTMSLRAIKAAAANPVKSLRSE